MRYILSVCSILLLVQDLDLRKSSTHPVKFPRICGTPSAKQTKQGL